MLPLVWRPGKLPLLVGGAHAFDRLFAWVKVAR